PLALRVTDRAGNPVSGVSVSWAQAVGAQLQGAAPGTDSDGRASATLRLDSVPASGTIVATAGSLPPASFPFTGYG
ncbi:MAG: Ig-like domain-containing protein, partial [Gemmatimonadetes bacterium]|nr:Ig-like domain-containing protein [Gemmatimonadota bacterium]